MKTPITTKILITLIILISGLSHRSSALAADSVIIVPFSHDSRKYIPPIAQQVSWLLQKKLETGRVKSQLFTGTIPAELSGALLPEQLTSTDLTALGASADKMAIILGRVTDLAVDRTASPKGARFFGVAEIPICVTLRTAAYDAITGQRTRNLERIATHYSPRVNVFGIHRHPFPVTPRSIDGLIHNDVVQIVREMILDWMPSESGIDLLKPPK